jgi:hypothetical protein
LELEQLRQQGRESLNNADNQAAMERTNAGITSRETIAGQNIASREKIATMKPENAAVLIKHWQDVMKKSFKPVIDEFGIQTGSEIIPGEEPTVEYAKSQIRSLTQQQAIPATSTGGIVPQGNQTQYATVPPYEPAIEAQGPQMSDEDKQAQEEPKIDLFSKPAIPQKTNKIQQGMEVQSILGRFGMPPDQAGYVLERLEKFTDNDQSEFIEILRTGNINAIQKALDVLTKE